MATLFMSPLSDNRGDRGEKLAVIHRTGPSSHSVMKIPLRRGHPFDEHSQGIQISPLLFFFFLSFRGVYPHIFSQISLSPIVPSCFFQVTDHPTKQSATSHGPAVTCRFSFLVTRTTTCPCSEFSPGRVSLHCHPSGTSQRELKSAAVHFSGALVHCTEQSVKQARVLLSPVC